MKLVKSSAVMFLSLLAVTSDPLLAATPPDANPVRGGQLFLQCRACHTVAPGAGNSVGPNLSGVFGAKAASRPGYSYSPALTKSKIVWSVVSLDGFLKRPSQSVPGTKMGFGGIADAKVRADLIAYMATLKSKK